MKVLFYSWEFPPHGTGVATYVSSMARALVQHGHEAVIVTGRAAGRPDREEGEWGRVFRLYGPQGRGSARVAEEVLSLARREKVDWIEGADHLGETARILKRRDRPPIVVKAHSSRPIRAARNSDALYGWQRLTIGLAMARDLRGVRAEHLSLTGADVLLSPSQRLKRELSAQGLREAEDIRVVPNPVTVVPQGLAPAEVPTLLLVGRITIGKGICYLPRILEHLSARHPGFILELAGGDAFARGMGSLQGWLAAQCRSSARHLRFLGALGPEALDAAYRRAWVVLCPSRWDNFPNAVLDAMVRGVPVVASPHGGMPEQLEGTGCPIADPASDAFAERVGELLLNPELRQRVGEAARQRALSAYHPSVIVPLYLREVLQGLERERTRA